MKSLSALLIVALLSVSAFAGELYIWVDDNGVKHYSDTPIGLPEDVKVVNTNENKVHVVESTISAPLQVQNIQQTVVVQTAQPEPQRREKTEIQIREERERLKNSIYDAKVSYLNRVRSRKNIGFEDRQEIDSVLFDLRKDYERLSPDEFFNIHGESTNFRSNVKEVRLVN